MAQQTACESFTQQMGEFGSQMQPLQDVFDRFVQDPSSQARTAVEESIAKLKDSRNAFEQAYQEKVIALFQECDKQNLFSSDLDHEPIQEEIFFEPDGRVVYGISPAHYYSFKKLRSFPALIRKMNCNFFITKAHFSSMDYLEEVTGELYILRSPSIASVARLQRVEKKLKIVETSITELPSLEYVGGRFEAYGESKFAIGDYRRQLSAPRLKTIGDAADVKDTVLGNMTGLEEVRGDLDMQNALVEMPFESLTEIGGALKTIGSSVTNFRETFPNLKRIGKGRYDISVNCSSVALAKQIEELHERGELQYDGKVG